MVVHFDWNSGGYLCSIITVVYENLQPYCISEMQTLWGEPEQVVTKEKGRSSFQHVEQH